MNVRTIFSQYIIPKNICLLLFTVLCTASATASADHQQLKAERLDASTFSVNCFDCCDQDNVTDCEFNEALSLLDVVISDIDALTTFEETCCANMTSSFTDLKSDLDALTTFEQTCCANMTSSFTNLKSDLDALTTFEQTCCSQTIALLQSIVTPTSACTKTILQADIPYTTTAPGKYCLGSNVILNTPGATAITINNSDVELELNEYTISLGAATATGIKVNAVNDVTIHNGILEGPGAVGINASLGVTNLGLTNLQIRNFGTSGIITAGNNIFVESIEISVPGATSAAFDLTTSTNVFMNNCIITGGLFGLSTSNTGRLYLLENLLITNASSHGVQFLGTGITMKTVACLHNGGNGFNMPSGNIGDVFFDGCQFSDNNTGGLIITQNPPAQDFGFFINDCHAQANAAGDGFQINCTAGPTGTLIGLVFTNCSSTRNGGAGFNIPGFGRAIVLESCIASFNSTDGFALSANTSSCQVISCRSAVNGNRGFFDAGGTNNLFANNSATGNTGLQFSGIANTINPPTTTTGFWANVFMP